MVRYLAIRVVSAVGVLWATFTVSFVILFLLPSDPVSIATSGDASTPVDAVAAAELKARYGLDQSAWDQYWTALGHVLRGDFGLSIAQGRPVTSVIGDALPGTMALTAAAIVVAAAGGVALAVAATYTRLRWLRNSLLAIPPLVVALPTFWVGLILLQLFSFRLRWFPAFGDSGVESLVLPTITLAIPYAAVIAQVLATSMARTGAQPFVQTATAKGASRWRVVTRHVLRISSIPTLTVTGVVIGNLLAGAVIVETVFSRSGLGRLAQSSVLAQDIPTVQELVVLSALAFVTVNLLVDIAYPFIDPRILPKHNAAEARDGIAGPRTSAHV